MAITKNDFEAIIFLIDSVHFDVNVIDEFGWSGLHFAAWLDLEDVATMLLSKGADPYLVTLEGFTALHIAAMRGFDIVARSILNYLKHDIRQDVCHFVHVKTKQRYRTRKKTNEKGSRLDALELALLPPMKTLFVHMLKDFMTLECPDGFKNSSLEVDQIIQPYCDYPGGSIEHTTSSYEDTYEISCLGSTGFHLTSIRSPPVVAVDIWDAAELSPSIFKHEYYMLQRPVLIRGNLSSHMGAWKYMYGSIDKFNTRYGDIITKTGEIPYADYYGGPPTKTERLSEYIRQNFQNDEHMLTTLSNFSSDWRDIVARISFDGSFFRDKSNARLLTEDFQAPSLFADVCGQRKEDRLRPYVGTHQLSIGPSGSGAPLHSHVLAWNVVFKGTKKWLIFPPGHLKGLNSALMKSNDTSLHRYATFPVSQGFGLNKKINAKAAAFALANGLAFEILQNPGDILVIPSHYGHGTMNVCGTISIAQEFGCLDDHLYNNNRLLSLPIMQPYPPTFARKSGYTRRSRWYDP